MSAKDTLSATHVKIGEAVDRLVTVDLAARGFIRILYEEARQIAGDAPLCLTAAREIFSRTRAGQPVVIATGLPIRGWFGAEMAENDGPIGAASLARACYLALKAVPILICEAEQQPVIRACLRAVGMTPTTFEQYDAAVRSPHAVPGRDLPLAIVQGFTARDEEVDAASKRVLRYSPSAFISIERQGVDDNGHYHYGRGEKTFRPLWPKSIASLKLQRKRAFSQSELAMAEMNLGWATFAAPFNKSCRSEIRLRLASKFPCWFAQPYRISVAMGLKRAWPHSPEISTCFTALSRKRQ